MIAIRHYLHANPELSLEEFKTSDLVAKQLESWGYKVMRADMDALPIFEETHLPWANTVPGKMHASDSGFRIRA